jgi:hypothetical protein
MLFSGLSGFWDPNEDAKETLQDTKTELNNVQSCWSSLITNCQSTITQDSLCLLQSNINDVTATQSVWNESFSEQLKQTRLMLIVLAAVVLEIFWFIITSVTTRFSFYRYKRDRVV